MHIPSTGILDLLPRHSDSVGRFLRIFFIYSLHGETAGRPRNTFRKHLDKINFLNNRRQVWLDFVHCIISSAYVLSCFSHPGKNTGEGCHFLLQGILQSAWQKVGAQWMLIQWTNFHEKIHICDMNSSPRLSDSLRERRYFYWKIDDIYTFLRKLQIDTSLQYNSLPILKAKEKKKLSSPLACLSLSGIITECSFHSEKGLTLYIKVQENQVVTSTRSNCLFQHLCQMSPFLSGIWFS